MADQITSVAYYVGSIPDKTGEGVRVLNAFKEAGVNLTGFLGYPRRARKAEVIFVLDEKGPNLAPIARKAGLELGKKQRGFWVNGEDRLGAVAEVMAKLTDAGLNIVSVHAMCGGQNRYGALITVAPPDLRKAGKALGV